MTLPVCPKCSKIAQLADAAFCPYCGAPMKSPKVAPLPDGAKKFLSEADKLKDPVKKRELLLQAEKQYPDCLEVAEALLFLGRLHERDPRKLDFSVIKCYLWHIYLTPREFSEEKKQEMRTELLEHSQLKRCQQLAPDAHAYTRRYLKRLACEFVSLFLKGSNHYTRTWFGFRFDNRMSRVLAEPTARMLKNIRDDVALEPIERSMLYDALYGAFLAETGGEPQWLNEELDKLGYPIPSDL